MNMGMSQKHFLCMFIVSGGICMRKYNRSYVCTHQALSKLLIFLSYIYSKANYECRTPADNHGNS